MAKGELLRGTNSIPYRKVDKLNQSLLSVFVEDPIKFYKIAILGEIKDDDDTVATKIGNLTDSLLLEHNGNEESFSQDFDKDYCLFNGVRSDKQVFTLVDELVKVVKRNVVDGKIVGEFEVMFQEAFLNTQGLSTRTKSYYSGKDWRKGLEDFNANGQDYYRAQLSGLGKKTVDLFMINTAKRITTQLINDDNTGPIFRNVNDDEVLNKYPIEFFWKGFECKMEADRIHIDHTNGVIQPYDLKTSWMDFKYAYLKNAYYIQNAWYYTGVYEWASKEGLDYTINPLKFIVGDTSPVQRRPLIYETTLEHIEEAYNGFVNNGRRYRGIIDLLDDIRWASDNGIWNISRENYFNNGIVKMELYDNSR